MADLGASIKNIWLKSMEAIGNTASSIASSTKTKVDEMNMMNRRSEILKDFGDKAYVLWQKGESFPPELEEQLIELKKLDEQLNDLRAERLAGVKTNDGNIRDDAASAGGITAYTVDTVETGNAVNLTAEVAEADENMEETAEAEVDTAGDTAEDEASIIYSLRRTRADIELPARICYNLVCWGRESELKALKVLKAFWNLLLHLSLSHEDSIFTIMPL